MSAKQSALPQHLKPPNGSVVFASRPIRWFTLNMVCELLLRSNRVKKFGRSVSGREIGHCKPWPMQRSARRTVPTPPSPSATAVLNQPGHTPYWVAHEIGHILSEDGHYSTGSDGEHPKKIDTVNIMIRGEEKVTTLGIYNSRRITFNQKNKSLNTQPILLHDPN